jgi:hypothetical protein
MQSDVVTRAVLSLERLSSPHRRVTVSPSSVDAAATHTHARCGPQPSGSTNSTCILELAESQLRKPPGVCLCTLSHVMTLWSSVGAAVVHAQRGGLVTRTKGGKPVSDELLRMRSGQRSISPPHFARKRLCIAHRCCSHSAAAEMPLLEPGRGAKRQRSSVPQRRVPAVENKDLECAICQEVFTQVRS